jgi:phosphatidylserine/phosphatidylglycerophosphate/cardiolipin synthase-like enzyme
MDSYIQYAKCNNYNILPFRMETYVGRHVGAYIEEKVLAASKYVKICSPWIGPEHARFIEKLVTKGILVKLLTSDRPDAAWNNNTGNESAERSTLDIIRRIKKSTREILEMNVKKLNTAPWEYRIVKTSFIHAKLYLIDGTYAAGGSANFTRYGQSKNVEHIFYTSNPPEVKRLEDDFEKLWSSFTEFEMVEDSTSIIEDIKSGISQGIKNLRKTTTS